MKINLSKIALLILLVLTCTKKKPMFKEPVARLTIQSIEQLSVKLFKAITQNNCEEVQSILCSVQGEDHEKLVNGHNKDEDYDMTPLMKAAKEEKYAIAKALLEAGADANRVGAIYNNSYTPLKWTIKNKDVRMVKLLMEHGADLIIPEEENQIDKNLVTALQGLLEETIEAGDPTLLMCLSRLEEDKVGLNVIEVLAALIDERNTLSEDILSTMMKQAADEEQWTIVRSLLERANHQIREEAIEHTFAQAVNSRQTAILDSLLTNNALSEDILSTMMKQAADEEQWTIVRSLLERTSHQIREEAIEHTFARAVNSRQTAILDSLLTHENTREKLQRSHLQKALSTAAAYNQETVVDALIDKRLDKLDIEEDILPILKQAASSGKESIVKAFFNPPRGVRSRLTTPMVAAVLFKVIAEEEKAWPEEEERKMEEDKAAIKIANTLLRRLKELSVDKATIEEALIEATKQGKENIVAGIINLDKIDQPMIERAFREAIRTGKTNIGTHLLGRDTARQHIDKRIISSALLEAAELNQLPTLQELVSAVLPHIDQEAIVEVFNQAIAHNNSALLAALLVEEKTKELLGKKIVEAFKQARAEDKHATVSVLLEKADNKLRDETVENAFLRAKQKNQVTMVGSLLQKGKIDSAMIADTFIEVVKEGKTAMVQVFLANAQLSGNTLKEAFNDVQAQNNSTLLTTFLQNQRVKESVDQAIIDQAFTTVVEESKERKLESLTKHQHTQVAGFLNSDAVSDVSSLFKTALEKALKDDAEIALLALFLDHSLGKVSQEALEEALKEAVGKGKEEVVTCLVDKSKSQLREEAIT
ncbi:MAG: ankyrin repeat domain-containing protein, partial [Cytophagales bacterium]|nr:ankyrin repeat domain-containing protein [Cytophagales bacterium]